MAVEALLLEHRQDFLLEEIRTGSLPSLCAGWRLTKRLRSGEGQKQNEGRRLRHDATLPGENDVNMMSWGKSLAQHFSRLIVVRFGWKRTFSIVTNDSDQFTQDLTASQNSLYGYILSLLPDRAEVTMDKKHGKQITTPAEAVRRILLREPTSDELRDLATYAKKNRLAALCRVLINSNEFLFVN
jgi:hypothetical protein